MAWMCMLLGRNKIEILILKWVVWMILIKRPWIHYLTMLLEWCILNFLITLKWKRDVSSYGDSSLGILVWFSSLYTTLFAKLLYISLERVSFIFITKRYSDGTFSIPYIALFLFLLILIAIYCSAHLMFHLSPNYPWSWRINLFFVASTR